MGNKAPHLNIDKHITKDLKNIQDYTYKDISGNANFKVKSAFVMDPRSFWHEKSVHCRYLGELMQMKQVGSG
jgi:hypothetical protein